ncbi:methyltransferase [Buttiauxella warmboldiae]|uniref:Methyltransferase n=1 Tax=Buttiauxella warmboldiae TaxID=82993 RepID=A0A3N5E3Y7_9ENTR|nr:AMP-binding protein [Buttiauxella warmboldiae]RPH24122.1 methyltransferase [Buttiauxella warmboldiae]
MSAVNAFIEQLQQLNIVLWVSGDKLRFRAPEGVFSPELRQQVSDKKAEIITALREQDALRHYPEQSEEPFPLTEVQGAYLLGRTQAWQNGGTGCHGYAELEIISPERWKADDYQNAWQRMISCHAMLRARISSEGWQRIDPSVVVPLGVSVCATAQDFDLTREEVGQRLRHRHYDPLTPPLIETHIVTMGNRATLHLSVDLIITDFIGIHVILSDFFQALNQPDLTLQPPSLSFRDYVLHVERLRATPAGQQARERAMTFWREKAATFPAAMQLGEAPPDTAGEMSYRRRSYTLDEQRWRAFLAQARYHAVTPTAVALAVLGAVARRYGEQARSRITLTVLDRQPLVEDSMRIVGDFTSTVLLTLVHDGQKNVAEVASDAQHELFEALDYSGVSGIEVLRMLTDSDRRTRSATPVVLTSTLGAGDGECGFYRTCLEKGLSQTPQVLLDIQLSDLHGGMAIIWDAKVGGYPEAVLDAAFSDFCVAITALAHSPARWSQPALTHKALDIALPAATNTAEQSLISSFCRLAQQAPDKLALVDGNVRYTRGALIRRACAWRDALYAQGSQAGDTALIVLEPGAEQVAAQFGALMAGVAFVPLDPGWPQARRQVICDTLQLSYPERRQHWLTAQEIPSFAFESPLGLEGNHPFSADEIAYIIFTSGSTGTPKGVPIAHRQALTTLNALQAMLNLQQNDRVLAVSRPSFDLAIFNIFGLLQAGGAVVIPSAGATTNPESWVQDMARHQVTIWNSVPAQLQLLLDSLPAEEVEEPQPLSTLRAALLSGDWIPVTQPAQLHQRVPDCRFIALGGATEAAIWSNYHEVLPGSRYDRSIPYGRALPGQVMKVLNVDGEETVCGQIGQIVIIGPAVSSGYLGADTSAFITLAQSGLPAFLTGDLGRYLESGEIEFLGRKDDQIKRHGHRIEPGEIAAVLQSHPQVGDAAAMMTPQNQLLAVVTPVSVHDAAVDNRVVEAIVRQHQVCIATLDAPRFTRLMETMELAALVAMQDIRQRNVSVRPEHRALMARWDRLLHENVDRLAPLRETISLDMAQHLWRQAKALAHQINYGDQQIAYVELCLQQLEEVVSGEVDPLTLLFPEGEMEVARASYGGNLINRYLNQLIVAGVEAHALRAITECRPLRIIELGAGVGGTTEPVIKRLRELQQERGLRFEYLFTDVSRFFLDEAADRWPEVTTRRFDLNGSFAGQGIVPASWDIALCANVLHNARHIPQALNQLHSLLAPGGDLAIVDATRPNAPLMITMEFKEGLTDFVDERAATGEAFYPRESWQRALADSPFKHSVMFPDDALTSDPAEEAIRMIHQSVIWARSSVHRAHLEVDELNALLRQRLPAWMIPDRLLILDALPLTANGKVDRKAIVEHLPTSVTPTSLLPIAQPLDDSQRAVAQVWAAVLGLDSPDRLTPSSSFFDVGGDSLLLAKCVGGLRKTIPGADNIAWDELLRQVVADPTLEHCARVVWQYAACISAPEPGNDLSAVSELLPACSQGGKSRAGEVLCLIHDGSGGLEPYRSLIAALETANERPMVLGISRTPGDGYLTLPAESLFDTLAERYVQALRQQPVRRVWLFGYCMGGLIAAVMAEKLTEAGIQVEQLIVASAYRIPFIIEDDTLLDFSLARLLRRPAADIGLDFPETHWVR